jgi:hypothetical protein
MIHYAHRLAEITISEKNLSKFMYAVLVTGAQITSSFGLGLDKYTRKQNAGNQVTVMLKIDRSKIENFQELSGFIIKRPEVVQGSMVINTPSRR